MRNKVTNPMDERVDISDTQRIKVGILANELFAVEVGRMGGFGWALRQVTHCFTQDPSLGVDIVLLMGERKKSLTQLLSTIHGAPVIWLSDSLWSWAHRLRSEKIDLILSIDYRPNYQAFFMLLPQTPILIWVRDPWDNQNRAIIGTLRVPGHETVPPQGVSPPHTQSLVRMVCLSRLMGRSISFAVTTPALVNKITDTYGVKNPIVSVLPNIVEPYTGLVHKAERPVIAFLGRLDPVKRPWLLVELARRLPEVVFVIMGQSHFTGSGSWEPSDGIPPNVQFLGHADEETKRQVLETAWLLLNTSIHEGLSVSFLEALAYETPIVSSVNPENVVSRFGEWVGQFGGTGMEGLNSFEAALRRLITDERRRHELGAAGRAWVETTHCRSAFLHSFFDVCAASNLSVMERK